MDKRLTSEDIMNAKWFDGSIELDKVFYTVCPLHFFILKEKKYEFQS